MTVNGEHYRIELYNEQTELMAWGCVFPSGTVVLEWNRSRWDEGDRLSHDHQSVYGSIGDVLKVSDSSEIKRIDGPQYRSNR